MAALAAALAALFVLREFRATRGVAIHSLGALFAGVGVGFALQPRRLAPESLSSGAGYYFAASPLGHVFDAKETTDGLLAVARRDDEGRPVSALLLNGTLYAGDSRETGSRYELAEYPMIHTRSRTRALVIGYGTGALAHAFGAAGFDHVDTAEPTADTIAFANAHFGSLNDAAFAGASLEVFFCSGRAMVLLSHEHYDVISVTGRNMSFRGESMLHDREFYELARSRLAAGGVLQDSIDLGRMDFDDVVSLIATLRSAFDHVTLYAEGAQGIFVACPRLCPALPDAFAQLKVRPEASQRGILAQPAARAGEHQSIAGQSRGPWHPRRGPHLQRRQHESGVQHAAQHCSRRRRFTTYDEETTFVVFDTAPIASRATAAITVRAMQAAINVAQTEPRPWRKGRAFPAELSRRRQRRPTSSFERG